MGCLNSYREMCAPALNMAIIRYTGMAKSVMQDRNASDKNMGQMYTSYLSRVISSSQEQLKRQR